MSGRKAIRYRLVQLKESPIKVKRKHTNAENFPKPARSSFDDGSILACKSSLQIDINQTLS